MASKVCAALIAAVLVLAAGGAHGQDKVTPTDRSVDLYGYSVGLSLEPGDVVTAHAASGVLCGQCTVRHKDAYGFLHVYRDDPITPEVEGAQPGEEISLKVNGVPVRCIGPDQPVWTRDGDRLQVDVSS